MNHQLTIKNFRVFDNDGVTLDIKPLTILTGCNSSGKSSVVKGVCLINEFIQQIKDAISEERPIRLSEYNIDFSKNPNSLLGNFDKVVNKNSENTDITFAYKVYSDLLSSDIMIEFSFNTINGDVLRDGYLHSLTILTANGMPIYKTSLTGTQINYSFFKNRFVEYSHRIFSENNQKEDIEEKQGNAILSVNEKIVLCNMMENGHLFYFPFMSKIDKMSKDEVKSFVYKRHKEEWEQKALENKIIPTEAVTRLVKDNRRKMQRWMRKYNTSSYIHLSDFIKEIENNFFDEVMTDLQGLTSTPCIITNKEIEHSFVFNDHPYLELMSIMQQMLTCDEVRQVMDSDNDYLHTRYIPFKLFSKFIYKVFIDFFANELPSQITYVGSDLVHVKRLYTFDATKENSFISLLKQRLNWKMEKNAIKIEDEVYFDGNGDFHMGDFTDEWINKYGIGKLLKITQVADGAGVQLRVYKNSEDKEGTLLADFGYGITQLVAILLSIEANRGKTIAIEEPENHLHPKFQSLLADMLVDAYQKFNINFVVETHSEYLIRKLQTLVAFKKITPKKISLVYVYDADKEKRPLYTPQVQSIEINPDGSLNGDFGTGFFDEADNLSMSLFLKQR